MSLHTYPYESSETRRYLVVGAWMIGIVLAITGTLYLLFNSIIVAGIGLGIALYMLADMLLDLRGQLEISEGTVIMTDSWWRKHRVPSTSLASASCGTVPGLLDASGKQKISLIHFSPRTIGTIAEDLSIPLKDNRWSRRMLTQQSMAPLWMIGVFFLAMVTLCVYGVYSALQYRAYMAAPMCHTTAADTCVSLVQGVTVSGVHVQYVRYGAESTISFDRRQHLQPITVNGDI